MKKYVLIFSCFLCLVSNTPLNAQSDNIIKGVGQFLTERAEDNFFYVFENNIKNNELFEYFFPNIYNIISTVDLKLVLTSKDLWEKSIKSDLDNLPDRIYKQLKTETKVFPKIDRLLRDEFLTLLQNAKIVYQGKTYPLNSSAQDDPQVIKSIVNDLSFKLNDLITNIVCGLETLDFGNFDKEIKNVKTNVDSSMHIILGTISEIKTLQATGEAEFVDSDNLFKFVGKAEIVFNDIKTVIASVEMIKNSQSITEKVIYSFDLIEYIVKSLPPGTFKNFDTRDEFDDYFGKFKNIALFFAQLSESKSADEVSAILKSFSMPSVSFGTKREPGEIHIFVQSYWGLTVGLESANENLFKKLKAYYGLSAPIGLELSHGNNNESSVSVFLSVVDFGQVVNSQLYNNDVNYTWADLLAPGLIFNCGLPENPLAAGLGIYYGKSLNGGAQKEYHLFIHFSFDMPLLTLF